MAIRVKAPDGSIVEFPDGTSEDVMQSAMAAQFGAAPALSPGVEPPSLGDVVGAVDKPSHIDEMRASGPLGELAASAALTIDAGVEGTLGLGDMLVDAAAATLDIAGTPAKAALRLVDKDAPWPNFSRDALRPTDIKRQFVDPALERVGAPDINVNDLSTADRLNFRAAEFAIPAALTLGAAAAPAAGGAIAARGGSLADDVLLMTQRQLREKPVRSSLEEIGAALGGSAGLTAAEESGAGQLGQAGGALLGALLASPAAGGAMGVADNVSGAGARNVNARIVQDAALNPKLAASNIAETLDSAVDAGVQPPSAFLSSDDAGLIGLERAMRSKADFGNAATEADRRVRSDVRRAIGDLSDPGADTRAPQRLAAEERTRILDALESRQQGADSALATAETSADEAARAAGQPLTETAGRGAEASRDIDRIAVDDVLRPRRVERNRRFADIDPERSVEVDTASIQKAIDDLRADSGNAFQSRITPTGEIDELEALISADAPVTFADLQDARSALAAAIRDADIGVDGAKAPPFVDKLRGLKAAIDDLEPEALTDPAAASRAALAHDFHRSEFAPFFGRGAGKELRKAIDRDDVSRSRTSPADTAGRFFIRTGRNSDQAARDLREIMNIAPDEDAGMEAVRTYMFASAARTLTPDGKVRPNRLNAWLDNHQGALEAFPEIETELRDVLVNARSADAQGGAAVMAARDELKRIAAEAKISEREFQNSAAAVFLDNDPHNAVSRIMGAKDRKKAMAETVALVSKDADAKAGFKTAVAEWLQESISGTAGGKTADDADPVTVGALTKLLRRHKAELSGLFSPKEMRALHDVNRVLRALARVDNVRGSNLSVTAELKNAEIDTTLLEMSIKARYGVLKGGSIMRIAGRGLGRVQELAGTSTDARAKKMRNVLFEISTDPEKAIHLLNYERTDAWDKKAARLFALNEAVDDNDESE